MQAARVTSSAVIRKGSLTVSRVDNAQLLRTRESCEHDGQECSSKWFPAFFWHRRAGRTTVAAFHAFFPYCFLTGYAQAFSTLSPGASPSVSTLFVRCPNAQWRVRPHSAHRFGSLISAPAARGARAATLSTRPNDSPSVWNARGALHPIHEGSMCSTILKNGNNVVQLKGEVIPSRVKGPVSHAIVCLLHGLLGSRRDLRTLGSCLAAQRVIAWDLRNHGQSPWRETMSIDDLARDVLYTLRERASFLRPLSRSESSTHSTNGILSSLESAETDDACPLQVVLVGHSLGGLTAMRAATLAESHATTQDCSTPRPPVRIAGIVVLDIAPVDYTKASEQERLRAHQKKTGTPSAEDVVQMVADLPMCLFENKKQLEKSLRTATNPSLPPRFVSWLMTGVVETTADDFDEHRSTLETATATRETPTERRGSDRSLKHAGPETGRPSHTTKTALVWRANISAIRCMLASKELGWRFTDRSVVNKAEKPSQGTRGDARRTPATLTAEREPLLINAPDGSCACYRSSGTQYVEDGVSKSHSAVAHGTFSGPALFLKGSESPYVDLDHHWNETLRIFPNAQCKVVPGAGHWVHADEPHVTAEYINEFLIKI